MSNLNKNELKKIIKISEPVTMSINKVAASGMSRQFSIFAIVDNRTENITTDIANLLGYKSKVDKLNRDYITLKGCGTDLAGSLSISIKRALYTKEDFDANNIYYHGNGTYILI